MRPKYGNPTSISGVECLVLSEHLIVFDYVAVDPHGSGVPNQETTACELSLPYLISSIVADGVCSDSDLLPVIDFEASTSIGGYGVFPDLGAFAAFDLHTSASVVVESVVIDVKI